MTTPAPLIFTDCAHERSAARFRVRANGVGVYVLQCLVCGRELRTLSRQSREVLDLAERVPFDENLAVQWEERRRVNHQRFWEERRAQLEQRRAEEEAEWWDWYNRYLESPQWKARRALVLKRAQGICEGCLTRPATQVHHTTYAHAGHELLFELVAICDQCHRVLHPDKDL